MKKIIIPFTCKIIRTWEGGFTALENQYVIKFRDSRLKHYFDKGDTVSVTLENMEREGEDNIREGYSSFYVQLKRFEPNGFAFMDVGGEPKSFFWDFRGFITHSSFETENVFDKNNIIHITIYRS